jgi:hypothetical protein
VRAGQFLYHSVPEAFGVLNHGVLVPLVYRLGLTSVSHAGSGDNFPETWGYRDRECDLQQRLAGHAGLPLGSPRCCPIVPNTLTVQINGHNGEIGRTLAVLPDWSVDFTPAVHEGDAFNPGSNTTSYTVAWLHN